MKPAPFAYVRPRTVEEVCRTLTEHGSGAQILAGGQSLVPMLNLRLARPRVLVDITRVDGLDGVRWDRDTLRIGATTTQRDLELHTDLDRMPILRCVVGHMGSVATRNLGTVGGAAALGDPVAELPVAMVTLGAMVTARSDRGTRQIPARDLYRGYYATALEPDEVLMEIAIPSLARGQAAAFRECTVRHWGDPTLVVAMATVTVADGRCAAVELGLGGVAGTPLRVSDVAASHLVGQPPSPAAIAAAAAACAEVLAPPSDVHASGAHRRRLARSLARGVLEASFAQVAVEVPA
jgi:aerobic carbon-monoxide dehydrogenase medium subunit